jgi:hypothetical protein
MVPSTSKSTRIFGFFAANMQISRRNYVMKGLLAAAIQDHLIGAKPRAIVNFHHRRIHKLKKVDLRIDPEIPSSLAQKMGIFECKNKRLDLTEWQVIARDAERRDEKACSICQSRFNSDVHVLLSCSHVYHQPCIASYEKFLGKRQCPLCRKVDYQKFQFSRNKEYYCIIIQKYVRMWLARKRYLVYRRTNVPKNPVLVPKYCIDKLRKLNMRFESQVAKSTTEIANLFAQIDLMMPTRNLVPKIKATCINWPKVFRTATKRGDDNCSICIQMLSLDNPQPSKPLLLLECSHVYHSSCLGSLEKYTSKRECPVCRLRNYEFRIVASPNSFDQAP